MADPVYKGSQMTEPPYCNKAGNDEIARLREENALLKEEVLGWREAFPGYSGGKDALTLNENRRARAAPIGSRCGCCDKRALLPEGRLFCSKCDSSHVEAPQTGEGTPGATSGSQDA